MTRGPDRRAVLAGLAALAMPGVAGAQVLNSPWPVPRPPRPPAPDLTSRSRSLIDAMHLTGAVSCVLADTLSGKVLVAIDPDQPLPPASVTKAVTAAYAFAELGPGHRFITRVLGTGPLQNGVLHGDLILAGGGAPGLSTTDLAALARDLRLLGLREVTGGFRIWSGALPQIAEIAPDQPDHLGYNPSVSGLNLNYNRVHFGWRRSGADYTLTMDARDGDLKPAVQSSRIRLAAREAPVYAHGQDPQTGREDWTVARGALGSGGARWLPVRDGGLYAADVFATLMRAGGIVLQAPQRLDSLPDGAVLASLPSPALTDIARGMLKYSTNLTAEVLGLSASAAQMGAPAADLASSGAAMTVWARDRLGMQASHFVDHSGLGDGSRATATDMCGALLRLGPDGALGRVLKEITLRRDDGSPEPLRLTAKTGTLNFVSALAGHIAPRDGNPMTFAIFTADLARRAAIAPEDRENPPGSQGWTRRSRQMQFDLVRLWAGAA
ncbi:MAG: D-alanyl-D-alanine carboxypeptidase [Rhodobacteraceae bacterium]|nr:D-alanyl-D-alanine carboxypeptidase [Paracoccaceae bacterium]